MVTKGKVERAVRGALTGLADYPAGLACFLGADTEDQVRPCVVVECFHLEEEPEGSGNLWAHVRVTVKSEADRQERTDDPVGGHNDRVEAVIGSLKVPDPELDPEEQPAALAALISAAESDFHCLGVVDQGGDPSVEGRSFVEGNVWHLYCIGRDLTA